MQVRYVYGAAASYANALSTLEHNVGELATAGYTLHGSPVVFEKSGIFYFAQAMTITDELAMVNKISS